MTFSSARGRRRRRVRGESSLIALLDEQFANPPFSENIGETHFGGFLRKKPKQQEQQQEVGVAILVCYCLS